MSESTASVVVRRGTAHASLAALGLRRCQLDLLAPLRNRVKIVQKRVKYSPFDKLYEGFAARLAGAHGSVEVNFSLRADPASPAAFALPVPSGCFTIECLPSTLGPIKSDRISRPRSDRGRPRQPNDRHRWQRAAYCSVLPSPRKP
jgi:hypothetical protein